MQKAEKERVVAELADRLKNAETLIVADYRGLTVTEIGELRGKLLEHGARFSVVKNTLTRRAAEEPVAEAEPEQTEEEPAPEPEQESQDGEEQ